ncbi:hypothetical protein BCV70DRAFT_11140 [Testicularia cyperi]|uniref:Uncharacterized protein n=1 Tax=Testicularia cyperi TaxID=1882483 RepID=A0A317XY58_9BASI|nr:hypothetical protein BCV70DRAFT_11140 [Testicularia cyperi]
MCRVSRAKWSLCNSAPVRPATNGWVKACCSWLSLSSRAGYCTVQHASLRGAHDQCLCVRDPAARPHHISVGCVQAQLQCRVLYVAILDLINKRVGSASRGHAGWTLRLSIVGRHCHTRLSFFTSIHTSTYSISYLRCHHSTSNSGQLGHTRTALTIHTHPQSNATNPTHTYQRWYVSSAANL